MCIRVCAASALGFTLPIQDVKPINAPFKHADIYLMLRAYIVYKLMPRKKCVQNIGEYIQLLTLVKYTYS